MPGVCGFWRGMAYPIIEPGVGGLYCFLENDDRKKVSRFCPAWTKIDEKFQLVFEKNQRSEKKHEKKRFCKITKVLQKLRKWIAVNFGSASKGKTDGLFV